VGSPVKKQVSPAKKVRLKSKVIALAYIPEKSSILL
jgi:hypothetical protein